MEFENLRKLFRLIGNQEEKIKISEILNRRKHARTRINYIYGLYEDVNELLVLNGLIPKKEGLKRVKCSKAKAIVTFLLNKGIAYNVEVMPLQDAKKYTRFLFEDLIEDKCE